MNANGWTYATSPSPSFSATPALAYRPSYAPPPATNQCAPGVISGTSTTLNNVILANQDPLANNQWVTYSNTFTATAGCTYTFSYDYTYYGANPHAEYLQAQVLDSTGVSVKLIGAQVSTGGKAPNGSGNRTGSFTPTVTGTYTFQYKFTYQALTFPLVNQCDWSTGDIGVTAPATTCT